MASIQSSPHPLAFKLDDASASKISAPAAKGGGIQIRIHARAIEGMQKEALVRYAPTNTVWRLACDEGPYLNGTDLAPFPLAFFTAGLASSFVSEARALAKQRGTDLGRIRATVDNLYAMEGSAFLGTMIGAALPVELAFEHEARVSDGEIVDLLSQALAASPGRGLLATKLQDVFSLFNDSRSIAVTKVTAHETPLALASEALFDLAAPAAAGDFAADIIRKVEAAKAVFGVEGGAGSSLKSEQKRTLHVRGICTLREDGLKRIRVQLFKPIGSVFEFLSDDPADLGGSDRAPDGLSYLSAGLAFCFLTQIGRYAAIRKHSLDAYRIIQDTAFSLPGASGRTGTAGQASPAQTHLTLETRENDEVANEMLRMGEQTCFLHAACRSQVPVKIKPKRL